MNESQWDEKLKSFLKKTGDDLKRAGTDIKVEAEKLMKEVKDPERQEKVKAGLDTFRVWARKTAEEVAHVVEAGVKKAEGAVRGAVDAPKPGDPVPPPVSSARVEQPPAAVEPMRHDTPVDTPVAAGEPPKKTIGGTKKKSSAKKASGAKKPLGKKRSP